MSEERKAPPVYLELLRHLGGKPPVPVAELPKHLAVPTVLCAAVTRGLVELGRPNHCLVGGGVVETKNEKGEVVARDVTPPELRMEPDFAWAALGRPGRKGVEELLAEDAAPGADPRLRLVVRRTTEGAAAVA